MIRKTKDGRWRVQVEMGRGLDGKRVRRTHIFRTKRDAEAYERECIAEKESGRRVHDVTLGRFVSDVWWPEKEAALAPSSIKSYDQELRLRVLPAFGDVKIADIDRLQVQRMISRCQTEKVARKSRDLLRNILNSAVQYGVVTSNVAAGRYTFPRSPETREKRGWLTTFARHREVLYAARGSEVETVLILGLCFGLRKGEILGARWDDLDDVLHVRRAFVDGEIRPTKTRESVRDLPVPSYARERLSELRSEGYICGGDEPLPPSTAEKRLRRWVSANIPEKVTIQTLRHSFASAAINAGVPVPVVSRWLGHTSIVTTYNRYVKTADSDVFGSLDAIEAAFSVDNG